MRVIDFDAKDVSALAFSADGRYLAVGGKIRLVVVYDLADCDPEAIRPIGAFHPRLSFHPRLPLLFAATGRLDMFEHTPGHLSQVVASLPHADWFGVSPGGSRLVVWAAIWPDTHITCWATGVFERPLWRVVVPGLASSDPLFPADDRFLLSVNSQHGTPHWFANRVTYALDTGGELDVSGCLQDLPEVVTLSPDGGRVACGTRDTIRVYPTAGGVLDFAHVKNGGKKHFTGLAFHPSGKYLAAASNDATVKLYDTATWEVARTFTWDIGRMRSIAFSPDGTLAAAGTDKGKVVVWDVDV